MPSTKAQYLIRLTIMLSNLNRVVKAATVAAFTVGLAFAATPAQKASAQVVGSGDSNITTLIQVIRGDARLTDFGTRYVIVGSGAGRNAFSSGITNHAATSGGLSNLQAGVDDGSLIALQEATLFIAFPYNVTFEDGTPFDVSITAATACAIFRGDAEQGDPTNWSEVVNENLESGPDLPIIRVARGDNSGATDLLQGTRTPFGGFVDLCNAGGFDIPAINNPGDPIFIDGEDSGLRVRQFNIFDGTRIPNQRSTDIIVPAASLDGQTADPFGKADATGNDDNSGNGGDDLGSYSQGIINNIISTNGAIGYTETAIARANGFVEVANGDVPGLGLVVNVDAPGDLGRTPIVASGPTYTVFFASGNGDNTEALQNLCLAITDTNNLAAAGFDPTPLPNIPLGEFGPDAAEGGSDRCFEIGE